MALDDIRTRIRSAATAAGRNPDDITLIAISKVQPLERVEAVLEAGHRIFGENRVQEAGEKWPDFRERFDGVDLHLVGPLQSNKLNRALDLFDAIHSLDRDSLAKKLANAVQSRGGCPKLFVQVNVGREPQKAGVDPDGLEGFLKNCRDTLDLPISGLMTIPPADDEPEKWFGMLKQMAADQGLTELSMGMSGDFETAIAHGATHVRIGSAIFGERTTAG
ncbi:YggS family pyridoxal phosphate-dependent enzyme [Amaricoccus tamworthensis]|uniref:YggS family pyridoxal phosphate-dependent enzyme n=1 Tax=Amaricoccus tamworthensis TaxID=57002 RepID=UPI003C7E755E